MPSSCLYKIAHLATKGLAEAAQSAGEHNDLLMLPGPALERGERKRTAAEVSKSRVWPSLSSDVRRVRRSASGRRGAVADDARAREVGPRHSSCEARERSGDPCCGAIRGGASHSGAGGAKGGDQGKCGPAKHVPGAEPGKRVTRAGSHTESRKGKEEGEAHRALPSYQYRPARRGVLRAQGECRAGCRSADVEGLRGRPRTQARGPA